LMVMPWLLENVAAEAAGAAMNYFCKFFVSVWARRTAATSFPTPVAVYIKQMFDIR
jgi:hypothetical protein